LTPFRRGKYWSLYLPRRSGGVVQRSTGTTDAALAKRMARMLDTLADTRRWDVLEAIDAKIVTIGQVWDAFTMGGLDALLRSATAEAAPKVLDYVARWIATYRGAPRTRTGYEQKVRTLLESNPSVTEFSEGWVRDRLATLPHTPATVRQYANALSVFADYLRAHRIVPVNPVDGVPLPKGTAKRTTWKSNADDRRLIDAAPEPFRSYFALVHATGAERDAALVMTRRDVDLANAVCRIPGTKNKRRNRAGVPIEVWALDVLTAHCAGLLPDAPLFPTITRRQVNVEHIAARTAANLPGYQLRDARHSYTVRAILRGEQLWKVSQWLGHANIGITAAVYTAFELNDAMAELNRTATPRATRGGLAS
jgi:integrase